LSSCQTFAALIEVDVVVDPNTIIHYYEPGDPPFIYPSIEDSMEIYLPSVVLAPGDIYRVNISFTDGNYIEVINGAEVVDIVNWFKTANACCSGTPKSNDGSVSMEVTLSRDVYNKSQSQPPSANQWNNGGFSFSAGFYFNRSTGDIIDGSLFGSLTVEFTVPTVLDGVPYSVQTYSDSRITMSAYLDNPDVDKNLLQAAGAPPGVCINPPLTDTNNDCKIDIRDFANMANEWLVCGYDIPSVCPD